MLFYQCHYHHCCCVAPLYHSATISPHVFSFCLSAAPAPVPPPRHGMSERRHDMERRLVLLLVSIIVAFFITNIPAAILSLTFSDDKRKDLNFQIFRAIANNLEFLNFGLNFILYFLFSKDIRNAFTALLRRTMDRLKEGLEGSSNKYGATNL